MSNREFSDRQYRFPRSHKESEQWQIKITGHSHGCHIVVQAVVNSRRDDTEENTRAQHTKTSGRREFTRQSFLDF